jgi:hypothetical protein
MSTTIITGPLKNYCVFILLNKKSPEKLLCELFNNPFILYSLFWGHVTLNVLQVISHTYILLMNIITYTTVNNDVRTTDPSIAYPHER